MPQEGSGTQSPDGGNKQTFTCKICFEQYTKHTRYPISLNCGHTFCRNCIKIIGQNKTVIQCGICRGNTYSDYRKLGKNIALIELLEFANLLANDDNMEKNIDENEDQEWQGATKFIAASNLEEFYEERNMLNEMIQQFLPFPLRSHLEQQIIELSGQVATIEAQIRKSGDNFRHIFAKVEKIRDSVMNQIAINHTRDGQDGPTSSTQSDPSHFLNITNFGGPSLEEIEERLPSPRIYRVPISDDSDDDNFTYNNWSLRNADRDHRSGNRQSVRTLLQIQQLPATPPSHTQQQSIMSRNDDGEWESSSGWGECDDQDQESHQSISDQPQSLQQSAITTIVGRTHHKNNYNRNRKNRSNQRKTKPPTPSISQQPTSIDTNNNSNQVFGHRKNVPTKLKQTSTKGTTNNKNSKEQPQSLQQPDQFANNLQSCSNSHQIFGPRTFVSTKYKQRSAKGAQKM